MPTSAELKDHLGGNLTFVIPIWKLTAKDGTIAAYAAHTRSLTFDSVDYAVSAVEISRPLQKTGLSPNSTEITGIFDEIITREELEGGKWKRARVVYEWVNYLDLAQGSTQRTEGFIGKVTVLSSTAYKMEFLSKSSALAPMLGELTSPTDRNPFPVGVNPAIYTFAAIVTDVTDRRFFKVDYDQTADNYFQYGVARFITGANAGLEMEIKSSTTTDGATKTQIELQLPFRSDIEVGDTLELVAGYDGTREQARDKFDDMVDFNAEPDLPGLKAVITYPE